MNQIPWKERVNMLSVTPDAATRDDVARMAAELSTFIKEMPKMLESFGILNIGAISDPYHFDGGCAFDRVQKMIESILSEGR